MFCNTEFVQLSCYNSWSTAASSMSRTLESEPEPMLIDEQHVQDLTPTQSSGYVTQSLSTQPMSSWQSQSVLDFASTQLRAAFGPDAKFKDLQLEVIAALVEQRKRMLIVKQAGWGKTFVYMSAAKALRERTGKVALIISPLLALIRNQILLAEQYDVSVKHIGASLKSDKEERREALWQIQYNQCDAIITTPEQLSDSIFDEILNDIGMVVVDEAHCICQWGNNFRLAYGQGLTLFMDRLKQNERDSDAARPVLVVSSTITKGQEKHLRGLFDIEEPTVRGSLSLSNLYLKVVCVMNYRNALSYLAEIVQKLSGSGIGIVYCRTVDKVETVARWLRSKGVKARSYHSNVLPDALDLEDNDEKRRFLDDSESYRNYLEHQFTSNAISVLVATSALGMGVDIPNIRYVVVFEPPSSLQILYQQFGRAGRGTVEKAHCVVMYIDAPSGESDAFFAKKEILELYMKIKESSSSRLTISELEMICNVPRETIQKILTYFSTMEQQIVAYDADERVWQKDDDKLQRYEVEVFSHMERMRNALIQETELSKVGLHDFLKNREKCMMKLLCVDLGGKEIPGDYYCGSCTVCCRMKKDVVDEEADMKVDLNLNTCIRELSANDVDMIRQASVRPLKIRKPRVPQGVFQTYKFEQSFLDDPRLDGVSVSSYHDGDLASDLKQLIKRYPRPKPLSDELIQAIIKTFPWPKSGVWITYIPSTDVPNNLMEDFAQRLASKLRYPFRKAVSTARDMENKWDLHNAYFRCRNLDGAYVIQKQEILPKPVILLDYLVRSGWTMLVVSELLRQAGSGTVFPVALLKMANKYE